MRGHRRSNGCWGPAAERHLSPGLPVVYGLGSGGLHYLYLLGRSAFGHPNRLLAACPFPRGTGGLLGGDGGLFLG